MTNDTRAAFEAWFAESRAGKGARVRNNLLIRRDNGDYQEDSTQRHWWTWQNAYLASRRAALEELKEQLRDPVAVHVAMLRGEIAKPAIRDLLHIYGESALAQFDRGALADEGVKL